MNIATLQNIIFYEYLPALLGEASPIYTGYKNFIYNFSQFILNVNIINKVFQSFFYVVFLCTFFRVQSRYKSKHQPCFPICSLQVYIFKKHFCILLSKNIT